MRPVGIIRLDDLEEIQEGLDTGNEAAHILLQDEIEHGSWTVIEGVDPGRNECKVAERQNAFPDVFELVEAFSFNKLAVVNGNKLLQLITFGRKVVRTELLQLQASAGPVVQHLHRPGVYQPDSHMPHVRVTINAFLL